MQYVPVVSSIGERLMPCHAARARELVSKGRAIRRFDRGLFYIQLVDRDTGVTQPIVVGIDPGSKREGFTVKSVSHTYINIKTETPHWVKDHVETRRNMRRARRHRKTPYRQCRSNRRQGQFRLPPSTRARWGWKLRIANWLARYYPIDHFVVEDIRAKALPGKRSWNTSFSPLEVGKHWFYAEIAKIAPISILQGYETAQIRNSLGLKKSSSKLSDRFEAHCIDSWTLANSWIGGHFTPDNKAMLHIVPLRFHRRQMHRLQPAKGGLRSRYGGTLSMGFKRGSWIKHPGWGLAYVGGTSNNRISLHNFQTGKRLCTNAKPEDCQLLTLASWRIRRPLSAHA